MDNVLRPDSVLNDVAFGTEVDKQKRLQSIYAQEICRTQVSYVDYLKDTVSFDNTDENMEQELEYTNEMFNDMTFMLCFTPMRRGASSKGLLQTMGFYGACCLFSKTFRKGISDVVVNMLKPAVDSEVERHPNSKWAKYKQRAEEYDEADKIPITPEVFGMMHVAFCEQAYEAMRLPNADESRILEDYMLAEDKLYRQAKEYGISSDVVDFYSNKVVQNITYQHPEKLIQFTELAYGNVNLNGNKYKYSDGPDYPYFFTPRRPESVNETLLSFSDACTYKLESAQTPDDVKKIVMSDDVKSMYENYQRMIYDDNISYSGNKSLIGSYYVDDILNGYNYRALLGNYDMTQTADDFIANGPKRVEIKSNVNNFAVNYALGGWMYSHPTYDVVHYERQAEHLYDSPPTGVDRATVEQKIRDVLAKRDECLPVYYDLSAFMTDYFKVLERDVHVESGTDVDEMYFDMSQDDNVCDIEVKRVETTDVAAVEQESNVNRKVSTRLSMLQSKFGSMMTDVESSKTDDVDLEKRV